MTLFMRGLGRRSWNSSGWPPLTPLSFPDTESYLWQLRSNFIRMTDRDCVLPEHGLEEQARLLCWGTGRKLDALVGAGKMAEGKLYFA